MIKQTKWFIGFGFLILGILIISASKLPQSTQYYLTVDELIAQKDQHKNQVIKLAGTVVDDSIEKNTLNASWTFAVTNNHQTMRVYFQGAMPDTFQDGAEVVLTGSLKEDQSVFIATQVLAKCASRYEEKLSKPLQYQKEAQPDA
ncbi:MAG: cytochrome c maturation protein CcmE [Bdellovibrionota bacterium]